MYRASYTYRPQQRHGRDTEGNGAEAQTFERYYNRRATVNSQRRPTPVPGSLCAATVGIRPCTGVFGSRCAGLTECLGTITDWTCAAAAGGRGCPGPMTGIECVRWDPGGARGRWPSSFASRRKRKPNAGSPTSPSVAVAMSCMARTCTEGPKQCFQVHQLYRHTARSPCRPARSGNAKLKPQCAQTGTQM